MDNEYNIIEARVVSVDDEYDGKRIRVRLNGFDGDLMDDELPYCFPLLPKLIHVYPKPGECVLVILEKRNSSTCNMFYIGPILSQPYYYGQELYDLTAMNMLLYANTNPLQNPDRDPLNTGTLPKQNDVAVIGRKNTDIILRDSDVPSYSELRLRCGYKSAPDGVAEERLHFNKIDPAYIQLKYKKLHDNNNKEVNSVINVVADRINLLSRDSSDFFNLTDQEELITDDELMKILEKAHPLAYGDQLIEFLKKFIDVFNRHTHKFSMVPPCLSQPDVDVLKTNLDDMLSKAVRIN